jgi:threonine dehydratase
VIADLGLHDIFAARRRLAPHLSPTPLRQSEWLSALTGGRVQLKMESMQPTNAFKVRGAFNAVLRLHERGDSTPLVTASAGNHGRALAMAAAQLGHRATVFTPSMAPETKKASIRRLGTVLRDEARDYDEAERLARAYADESKARYVSPYNDVNVIAGAGTIALEILEAAPETSLVVLPLGGGGLASGVGLAIKHAAPGITVVGVEVSASTPFATGFALGAMTTIEVLPSVADGLIGNLEPGSITFDLVRRYVDRVVSVGEEDVIRAIRGLGAEEHVIAEGAGAAATAAVLADAIVAPGQRAVVLLTGGNIDLATYATIVSG